MDKQIKKLDSEEQALYDKIARQEERIYSTITGEQLKQYSVDLVAADFPTKQAIVQKLVRQIYVDSDDIEIEWAF
ncbi:hypothetical protein [Ammoniphilus sp. 3BR4]|uniref:hypothetical protein n=1 Tax=Ammoniphilus sp. 3BR4 TaxID=3158265 RepID=UPI00346723B1